MPVPVTAPPRRATRPHARATALARRATVAWLLTAAAAGCLDAPVAPTAPAVLSAALEPGAVPLVRTLDVVLAGPGGVEATYWSDGLPPLRVESAVNADRHSLVLARLHAGRHYTVEVRALDGAARRGEAWRTEFSTEALPAELAGIGLQAQGASSAPLTMIEIARIPDFRGFVVVDRSGSVVWFHPTTGGANGAVRHSDGSFVLLDEGRGLLKVSPAGRVLAEVPQDSAGRRIHHDVIETPSGTLLFLALDRRPARDTVVAGEAIWEWNAETGELQQRWSSWDHFDPEVDWGALSSPRDWLHANSLAIGPRGNVLVSFHFLNQVISIAPGYQALEWRLGGEGATVQVPDAERFSGQHTAAEIAPGRVLMFDNGFERVDERYSRAVEFALDVPAGQAEKVWEWRASPDIWSRIVSLARRLPGGNTFVSFGASPQFGESSGPVAAFEVTPAGEVVWRLEVEGVGLMYRAWPLADLAGESTVP